jgi:hypothetical protein
MCTSDSSTEGPYASGHAASTSTSGDASPLRRTAIEIENNLHREWFDRPENAYMFRPAFREYIAKNFPKPAPAPVAAAS